MHPKSKSRMVSLASLQKSVREDDFFFNQKRRVLSNNVSWRAWNKLAEKLEEKPDKIRRAWENLLCQYRRDLKSQLSCATNFKWRFYNDMNFIRTMVRIKESVENSDGELEFDTNADDFSDNDRSARRKRNLAKRSFQRAEKLRLSAEMRQLYGTNLNPIQLSTKWRMFANHREEFYKTYYPEQDLQQDAESEQYNEKLQNEQISEEKQSDEDQSEEDPGEEQLNEEEQSEQHPSEKYPSEKYPSEQYLSEEQQSGELQSEYSNQFYNGHYNKQYKNHYNEQQYEQQYEQQNEQQNEQPKKLQNEHYNEDNKEHHNEHYKKLHKVLQYCKRPKEQRKERPKEQQKKQPKAYQNKHHIAHYNKYLNEHHNEHYKDFYWELQYERPKEQPKEYHNEHHIALYNEHLNEHHNEHLNNDSNEHYKEHPKEHHDEQHKHQQKEEQNEPYKEHYKEQPKQLHDEQPKEQQKDQENEQKYVEKYKQPYMYHIYKPQYTMKDIDEAYRKIQQRAMQQYLYFQQENDDESNDEALATFYTAIDKILPQCEQEAHHSQNEDLHKLDEEYTLRRKYEEENKINGMDEEAAERKTELHGRKVEEVEIPSHRTASAMIIHVPHTNLDTVKRESMHLEGKDVGHHPNGRSSPALSTVSRVSISLPSLDLDSMSTTTSSTITPEKLLRMQDSCRSRNFGSEFGYADEDYHFVMSILPWLRHINGNRKLTMRMRIMNLISSELDHSECQ